MQQAMVEATTASTVTRQNGIDESSESSSEDEDEKLDTTKGDEERETDAKTEALLQVIWMNKNHKFYKRK